MTVECENQGLCQWQFHDPGMREPSTNVLVFINHSPNNANGISSL